MATAAGGDGRGRAAAHRGGVRRLRLRAAPGPERPVRRAHSGAVRPAVHGLQPTGGRAFTRCHRRGQDRLGPSRWPASPCPWPSPARKHRRMARPAARPGHRGRRRCWPPSCPTTAATTASGQPRPPATRPDRLGARSAWPSASLFGRRGDLGFLFGLAICRQAPRQTQADALPEYFGTILIIAASPPRWRRRRSGGP